MSNAKQLKDNVAAYYDDAATVYKDLYVDHLSKAENDFVAKLLNTYLQPRRSSVLDLGCGDGLGYELAKWKDYTGLDISKSMIEEAKRKHPKTNFFQADMESLEKYKQESFDAVISTFGSFSHVLYPAVTIEQIHRILRPGGRALIMVYSQFSVKNFRAIFNKEVGLSAISPIQEYKIRNLDMKGSFARFYTKRKLERLFYKFQVVKCGGLTSFLELNTFKARVQQNPNASQKLKQDLRLTKLFPNLGHSLYIIVEK